MSGFSRAARLHRRADFLRLQRTGQRRQVRHFVIYARWSPAPSSRLGITVSRKAGNAVMRNRIKRRVREAFRLHLCDLLPTAIDLVVIARAGTGVEQIDFSEIRAELGDALRLIDAARAIGDG